MVQRAAALLHVALRDFTRNSCHYVAAGIAYWALFSLFPLALAAISIFSFIYTTPREQAPLVEGIVRLIPVSEEYLIDLIGGVAKARGTLGLVAIIGLLVPGAAVFAAVRKGINHAWHIGSPHPFLLQRAIDLIMLMSVVLLAFITVVFTTNTLGVGTLPEAPNWLGGNLASRIVEESVGLVLTAGARLLLYRYVPNTTVVWRDTWPGAITGALLLHGIGLGFGVFVAKFSTFNLVYGSLGALMAVLVWSYLSSMALMWGAQVTYTYSHAFGSRAGSLPELQAEIARAEASHSIPGILSAVSRRLSPFKRSQL